MAAESVRRLELFFLANTFSSSPVTQNRSERSVATVCTQHSNQPPSMDFWQPSVRQARFLFKLEIRIMKVCRRRRGDNRALIMFDPDRLIERRLTDSITVLTPLPGAGGGIMTDRFHSRSDYPARLSPAGKFMDLSVARCEFAAALRRPVQITRCTCSNAHSFLVWHPNAAGQFRNGRGKNERASGEIAFLARSQVARRPSVRPVARPCVAVSCFRLLSRRE